MAYAHAVFVRSCALSRQSEPRPLSHHLEESRRLVPGAREGPGQVRDALWVESAHARRYAASAASASYSAGATRPAVASPPCWRAPAGWLADHRDAPRGSPATAPPPPATRCASRRSQPVRGVGHGRAESGSCSSVRSERGASSAALSVGEPSWRRHVSLRRTSRPREFHAAARSISRNLAGLVCP